MGAAGRFIPLHVVFFASALLMGLGFRPGTYLNDETVQTAALDGLARGHVWISGDLPRFADYTTPHPFGNVGNEGLTYGHWAIPAPGHRGPPVGSNMMNFLALPMLGALTALAALVGTAGSIAIVVGGVCMIGAVASLRFLRVSWRWQAAAVVAISAAFLPSEDSRALDLQPALEFSALQLLSILATCTATTLLFDLVRRWANQQAALLGAVAFLGSPALFWGETAKYGSVSACLLVLALWCYQEGPKSSPLRTSLAFSMVGLAVWNQLPWGLLLGFALGLASLGVLRLGARGTFNHYGFAILGFMIGLVPELLTRLLLAQAGSSAQYGSASAGVGTYIARQTMEGGLLHYTVFGDPNGTLLALSTFAWTQWRLMRYALPIFAVAPVAAVGVAGVLRRSVLPRWMVWFTVSYVLVVVGMLGRQFVNIGGGWDPRYGLTFWPILCIAASLAIANRGVLDRPRPVWSSVVYGSVGGLLATIGLNLGVHAAHHNVTEHGIFFDQTAVFRYGGTALAAALGVAFASAPKVGSWVARGLPYAVGVAVGVGIAVQVIVGMLDMEVTRFSAWPMRIAMGGLKWILLRHWPQYGI